MPELPEVEITRRGIAKLIRHKTVQQVIVRQPKLRWQIPSALQNELPGTQINQIKRRGKYILLRTQTGTVIIHLGMSGQLRVLPRAISPDKHDHVDFIFTDQSCLRFTDPRRFGSIHWITTQPLWHPLLQNLGPEPLSKQLTGDYLYQQAQKRTVPIKTFIMNSKVVVGVGNIYANEALFLAGIHPQKPAGKLSKINCQRLCDSIQIILKKAIQSGGTTLKDFYNSDGKPGYFKQQLNVYGKENEPCPQCHQKIKKMAINQRSSYYCPCCQRK